MTPHSRSLLGIYFFFIFFCVNLSNFSLSSQVSIVLREIVRKIISMFPHWPKKIQRHFLQSYLFLFSPGPAPSFYFFFCPFSHSPKLCAHLTRNPLAILVSWEAKSLLFSMWTLLSRFLPSLSLRIGQFAKKGLNCSKEALKVDLPPKEAHWRQKELIKGAVHR